MHKSNKKPFLALGIFAAILVAGIIIVIIALNQDATQKNDPEAIFQQEATKLSEEYTKAHPAITVLPLQYANYDKNYNYTEFRIDGGSFNGCDTDFCLQITDESDVSDEATIRKLATDLLTQKGINPSDYKILYLYQPVTPLK